MKIELISGRKPEPADKEIKAFIGSRIKNKTKEERRV